MAFVDAFYLNDLPTGRTYGFELAGRYLIAIRVQDSIFVLDGFCTHERMRLGDAPLDGFTLYCPRHFSSFDIQSGDVLGPPAETPLKRYEAKVVSDRVFIDLDGTEASAADAQEGDDSAGALKEADDVGPDPGATHAERVPRTTFRLNAMSDSALARRWTSALWRVVHPAHSWLHRRGWSDWLHGTKPLGHPLHPALTDLPMGLWTSAVVLYACQLSGAASITTIAGLVVALAAAVTGLADWSVSEGRDRRAGALHGAGNLLAILAEIGSVVSFFAGANRVAFGLCAFGLAATLVSAYVGGHLVFDRGAMVNHAAFIDGPRTWTAVGDAADVPHGQSRVFTVGGRQILVTNNKPEWAAIESSCTHAGARLDQGKISSCTVVCPLHESVFSLLDGSVIRGPAVRPQPSLDVRIRNGTIEVRKLE